jgi:hypothetical protein
MPILKHSRIRLRRSAVVVAAAAVLPGFIALGGETATAAVFPSPGLPFEQLDVPSAAMAAR